MGRSAGPHGSMQMANVIPSTETSDRWLPVVESVIEYAFHVLVFALPLAFYVEGSFKIYEFAKLRVLYSAAVVIFGGWALSVVLRRRFVFYRTPLDIPLVVYVVALAVSTALSTNVPRSLWGRYGTPSGAFVPIATCVGLYFAYVANMRTRERLMRNLWWFVAGGATTAAWGVLQHYGLDWINTDQFDSFKIASFGTIGNRDPQGWYLALMFPAAAWLFFAFRGRVRILTGGLWCFLVLGLLSAGSRSGFVGVLGGVTCLGLGLATLRRRQPQLDLRPAIALVVLFVLSMALFVGRGDSAENLTTGVSFGSLTSGGSVRLPIWRDAIRVWQKHPILGSGLETFGDQDNLIRPGEGYLDVLTISGHAHNQYLQYLATAGLVGLAAYALVIGVFLIEVLRIVKKLLSRAPWPDTPFQDIWPIALAGSFVSILLSQNFNPDFLPTTLAFFMLPAMAICWGASEGETTATVIDLSVRPFAQFSAAAGIALAVVLALQQNVQLWGAHVSYRRAIEALEQNRFMLARDLIDGAVATNPLEANYWWVKAQTYASLANVMKREGQDFSLIQKSESVAVASSNRSVALDPAREDLWRQRAICFRDLGEVDTTQIPVAIDAIKQAIARFPNSGLNYLFLARLEARHGDRIAAVQALVTAIVLSPSLVVAHAELGALYYRMGDRAAAAKTVARFLELKPTTNHWNLVSRLREEASMAGDDPSRVALEAYLRTMPRPSR